MEKSERRSKKDEKKEKKRNQKALELNGNNNKNLTKEKEYFGDTCSEDEYISASSSPRGVFEVPISGTDSDSTGSSNYSNTGSQGQRQNGGGRGDVHGGQQWRSMIDALRFKSVRRFSTIPLLAASYEISRRNLRNKLARIRTATEDDENDLDSALDLDGIPTKPSWRNFSYSDLVAATDDFNPSK